MTHIIPIILIPQRNYGPGTATSDISLPQTILFARRGGDSFPAELALAGKDADLVDKDGEVFTKQTQAINIRIEVFDLCLVQNLH